MKGIDACGLPKDAPSQPNPVFIEQVTPQRGFRRIQAAELSDWDGSVEAPAFPHFVGDLTGVPGPPPRQAGLEAEEEPREPISDAREGFPQLQQK